MYMDMMYRGGYSDLTWEQFEQTREMMEDIFDELTDEEMEELFDVA